MAENLTHLLIHYNLYRKHGSLMRELKVKTPFDAVVKWYELDEKSYNQKTEEFKNKTLDLKL